MDELIGILACIPLLYGMIRFTNWMNRPGRGLTLKQKEHVARLLEERRRDEEAKQ